MTKDVQQYTEGKYTPDAIAKMVDLKEIVQVKDIAESARIFYAAQDAILEANKAQEIKLRLIRQAGTILLPPAQGGSTPRERGGDQTLSNLTSAPTPYRQTLDDAGISGVSAHTWQKVARVPTQSFEAYLAEVDYTAEGATITGLLKYAGTWFGRSDMGEWKTPQWLFDTLNKEFEFDLDVCAVPENAKCKRYYTPDDDALMQNWKGTCWMNPPYGTTIKDWMSKARQSAQNGAVVVCLVPARPDTNWWWNNCIEEDIKTEIRFIKGRLQWPDNDTVAPFPSAVVVMRQGARETKVVWWNVQTK